MSHKIIEGELQSTNLTLAIVRAGSNAGNKGVKAAVIVLEMVNVLSKA